MAGSEKDLYVKKNMCRFSARKYKEKIIFISRKINLFGFYQGIKRPWQ